MDCKGVTAIVVGGVIGVLVRHMGLGPNKFVRLHTINAHREEWYGARPRSRRLPNSLENILVLDDGGNCKAQPSRQLPRGPPHLG